MKLKLLKGLPELMEVDFLYIKRVINNLVTAINQHVEVSDDLLISIIIFYDHDNSFFSLEFNLMLLIN